MKSIYTLIVSFLVINSFAQTIKIVEPSNLSTDVNNTTLTVNGLPSDFEIDAVVWVINTGSTSMDILCKKTEVDVLATTENITCWKLCPPTYDVAGTRPVVIVNINGTQMVETAAPGDTIKSFAGHYKPLNLDGCSLFKYEWFDSNDMNTPIGTIYVRYVHTTGQCTAAVDELESIDLSLYPIPASDYLSITTPDIPNGNFSVEFYNILGAKVGSSPILTSNERVDITNFTNGIYFAKFILNGKVVSTKKISVRN